MLKGSGEEISGPAGYFEKPYEAEELFGAIRQALA
jgi:hypothetical protein